MRTQRRWSELTRTQQVAIVTLGAVELALTATALVDLARRPGDQVRGRKALWAIGVLVQPVGPIAYLCVGRVRE
jgi:hypothetical protein